MIVIDCETSALPDKQLNLVKPTFEADKRLTDPEKIKASIAEKEAAWLERAALSPLTGRILAIGLLDTYEKLDASEAVQILVGPEKDILEGVWYAWAAGSRFAGFNVKEFDFRFMEIRSRILNVPVPDDLHEGRYWNKRIICLQELFCAYSRDVSGFSLDAICRACGLGQKPEGVTGKDFAKLFETDREKALEYLRNDLLLTQKLAQRLGIQ